MSVKLHPSALKLAEQAYRRHHIYAPHGVTIETLQERETWAHLGDKLRPTDRIDVTAEDGSFCAELLVLSCGRLWADIRVLHHTNLGAAVAPPDEDPEFETIWGGPVKRWGVRRISDKAWMTEGCASREDAATWLSGHLKAMAR